MIRIVKEYIKKMINNDIYIIPKQYKKEFIHKIEEVNLYRQKIVLIGLSILNIILIYVDLSKFRLLWEDIPGYRNLFYFHIAFIVYSILTLTIIKIIDIMNIKEIFLLRSLNFTTIFFMLMWNVLISINAQLIHNQISAYIIASLAVGSLIILNELQRYIVFISTYVIFIIGILIIQKNPQNVSTSIINSLFVITLSIIISKLKYTIFYENFINKKVIIEKNEELDYSNKELEKTVEKRTIELTEANNRMINELKLRHKIEVESVKTKKLYEENVYLLNEIMKYEKIRSTFFANISHELRTPLNLIYSAQQLMDINLDNKDLDRDKLKNHSKIMKQNSYRLMRIINNIIDMTKMDTGYFNVNFQNVNIVKVVEDITLSVVDFTETYNIKLIFDTEIEEKIIACDPDMIERIILNLLSNSVKFTHKDGLIIVSVYLKDNKVMISVKDNGIGIPSEMHDMIFNEFVQVDKSISRNKEGSGIGLALVKSLVDMQDGDIKLISETGNGSEFIIELLDRKVENVKVSESNTDDKQIIEKINIEFSDIYSN